MSWAITRRRPAHHSLLLLCSLISLPHLLQLRSSSSSGLLSLPAFPHSQRPFSRTMRKGFGIGRITRDTLHQTLRRMFTPEAHIVNHRPKLASLSSHGPRTTSCLSAIPNRPVLVANQWKEDAQRERESIQALLGEHISGKKGRTKHHPIFNFIFEYYMFKPKMLLQYSPGLSYTLAEANAEDPILPSRGFSFEEDLTDTGMKSMGFADPMLAKPKTVESLRWTRDLLKATSKRKPELHCYGMHEWAMLYFPEDSSHPEPHKYQSLPLRISQETLNSVVESEPIRCTHFDAFRFFAKDAIDKNVIQPSRKTQPVHEQPGCLHANMDLFKWTIKLYPWVPSSLLHKTLRLAVRARILDMRASPYDVEGVVPDFDLSPIRIETPEGRAEYKRIQADLWKSANVVREELIVHYDSFLEHHPLRNIEPARNS